MKVYIDFDDVICETGVYFTKIAKELFDIDLPYKHPQPVDFTGIEGDFILIFLQKSGYIIPLYDIMQIY